MLLCADCYLGLATGFLDVTLIIAYRLKARFNFPLSLPDPRWTSLACKLRVIKDIATPSRVGKNQAFEMPASFWPLAFLLLLFCTRKLPSGSFKCWTYSAAHSDTCGDRRTQLPINGRSTYWQQVVCSMCSFVASSLEICSPDFFSEG